MDVIPLSSSDRNLHPKDNDHTDVTESFWKIVEEGTEEEEVEEECSVIEVGESSNVCNTPKYKSVFTGFLTEKEYSMETGQHIKNDCTPKRTCFNCLGDHNISECNKKRDYQAIAKNKATILGKRPSNVRYHEDGDNKFSNYRPGLLSKNLINALGIKDSQAPDFIYRMRFLGYPPGWLKDAEVKRSTMALIDGSGKAMSHPDDEEGETDVCLTKYQPEKFISFPGFNVPFPAHVKDESRALRYPEMQQNHRKENFLKYMKLNKADLSKKRKKMKDETSSVSEPVQQISGDMDVDDSGVTHTVIELNETVSEAPTKEDGEISSDSNDCKSNSESNCVETPPCVSNEVVASLKRGIDDSSSDSSSTTMTKVKRHHRSTSKGFTLGVCIPESITPFDKLPEPSKWSVDVSDHILFDNLPDALGTWQKMKGIVKNVQNKLQKLHTSENDS